MSLLCVVVRSFQQLPSFNILGRIDEPCSVPVSSVTLWSNIAVEIMDFQKEMHQQMVDVQRMPESNFICCAVVSLLS